VTLRLTKTGDVANGAVQDDTGQIKCDFGCTSASGTYATGTTVTLSASSRFSYVIWNWSGGNPPVTCGPNAPTCAIAMTTDQAITVDFINTGFRAVNRAGANVPWTSEVRMEKTELQVIANGVVPLEVREGRTSGLMAAPMGDNRIEATVVSTGGRAGTWRFDLPSGAVAPGSLRVLAGDVALVTDSGVVFQLKGKVGERVVFTFKSQ
jgi:hypothetical protein